MVTVGIVFVVNSLDSLIRLYTHNIEFTVTKFGAAQYVAGNWAMLATLVLLFQFTPLKIEWIGLVVVGLYSAIYFLLIKRRRELQ
jgi:hypothetical protein